MVRLSETSISAKTISPWPYPYVVWFWVDTLWTPSGLKSRFPTTAGGLKRRNQMVGFLVNNPWSGDGLKRRFAQKKIFTTNTNLPPTRGIFGEPSLNSWWSKTSISGKRVHHNSYEPTTKWWYFWLSTPWVYPPNIVTLALELNEILTKTVLGTRPLPASSPMFIKTYTAHPDIYTYQEKNIY